MKTAEAVMKLQLRRQAGTGRGRSKVVRKFPYGNFLSIEVKKVRYTP